MPALIDLTGHRLGRLVAMWPAGHKGMTQRFTCWLCACDCGGFAVVKSNDFRRGTTRSCGCLRLEGNNLKHGMTRTPTWNSWQNMLWRALNHNGRNPTYTDVDVCDRWRDSFEAFKEDMGVRPPNTTLGRFGDVGNYEPGNCAWQTRREQNETRINKHADLAMAA